MVAILAKPKIEKSWCGQESDAWQGIRPVHICKRKNVASSYPTGSYTNRSSSLRRRLSSPDRPQSGGTELSHPHSGPLDRGSARNSQTGVHFGAPGSGPGARPRGGVLPCRLPAVPRPWHRGPRGVAGGPPCPLRRRRRGRGPSACLGLLGPREVVTPRKKGRGGGSCQGVLSNRRYCVCLETSRKVIRGQ